MAYKLISNIYYMINKDIENQINNEEIKKISCVTCTIISSTFSFCS